MAIQYPTFTPEELQQELWQDIPDYPGYQASTLGRIRSVTLMTPRNSKRGWRSVRIRVNGQEKTVLIHKLVALSFLGPRPYGLTINHIDGAKPNNKPENLEYCTNQENIDHAVALGLFSKRDLPKGNDHWMRKSPERVKRGEKHPCATITDAQARQIKELLKRWRRVKDIAAEFSISPSTVCDIKRGKRLHQRQRKLSNEQARAIEQACAQILTPGDIARIVGVPRYIIHSISRGRNWMTD